MADGVMGSNRDGVLGSYGLYLLSAKAVHRRRYWKPYRDFLQNCITNGPFNLLDLLQGCSLVQAPDEKIYVARRRKLLVIILA